MEPWQAAVLGIVEGITEYLPVSSTAHLLIAQRLMGIVVNEASNSYAIVIQGGAIVAVVFLYYRRILQLIAGVLGRDAGGRRLALNIVVAFLPAAVAGLAFDDVIERYLFGPGPIALAWAAGGLLLLGTASRMPLKGATLESLSARGAFIVGVYQCAALWPGVSRSLATILAGTMVGLSLAAAVEFSFLLGLVTLSAASAYAFLRSGSIMLESYGLFELAIGFVTAWAAAMVAISWMVRWLQRRPLSLFGWWRLLAAAALVAMMAAGTI